MRDNCQDCETVSQIWQINFLPHNFQFIALLAYFRYFEENKSRLMRSTYCLCISPINFRISGPIFIELGRRIMEYEPTPGTYFIKPSHRSGWLYVYPTLVARQRLDKAFLRQRIHTLQ
jgi:hypothetical protein